MTVFGRTATSLGGERGAIVVFVALFFPVAILFMAFTIDATNWFAHKRHLQLQADAAALATGQAFNYCFNSPADPSYVYRFAGQYGGVSQVTPPSGNAFTSFTPLHNTPLGNSSALNMLINSQAYFGNQSVPADTSASGTDPCSSPMMADVKLTETNLPWYFKALQVPFINAHARVELKQKAGGNNNLPLGVALSSPTTAEAYLVDDTTGTQLQTCGSAGTSPCFTQLTGDPTVNPEVLSDALSPLPTTINAKNVGVRIAFAGPGVTLTGTMSSDCGIATVTCYDAANNKIGLVHIQGWSSGGTGSSTTPLLRAMTLISGDQSPTAPTPTCSINNAYFSNPSASCTVGVQVNVDFGSTTLPAGAEVDATVKVGNNNVSCYPLTYNNNPANPNWISQSTTPSSSSCPGGGVHNKNTGFITLASGAGATEIDLLVNDTAMSNPMTFNTSAGSNSGIQRAYTATAAASVPPANANSGPIQSAAVFENATKTTAPLANSWQMGTSGNLTVQVSIPNFVDATPSASATLYTLQTGGNQTGAVACDPRNFGNFGTQLQNGCQDSYVDSPTYKTTPSVQCADPNTANPQTIQGNWGVFPNPPSWTCVQTFNGDRVGQVKPSLNARFANTCNNWPNLPANDPRVVTLFILPYGSFTTTGITYFPVVSFADFYIAGWDGDTTTSPPCAQPDAKVAPGNAGKDTLVGYFIHHVDPGSIPSPNACDPNSITACTPALTQ